MLRLIATGLGLLIASVASAQQIRATDETVTPPPRQMLRSYLHGLASGQLARRAAEVAGITTREQFEKRRAYVRENLLRMIGGLPSERTPLNLQRTGRLDREDYRVEKIIYESLPSFYVTANLYVPKTGKPPYPAVLHPTGHSLAAKKRAFYQNLSIGLAKQGFVVLTYDPIGQGERRIFYDPQLEDSEVGPSTTVEHSMVGIQGLLAGESVARYRIWDGMRSIDLLQSLPEVDGNRIAVTGCSGGGTLSVYIAALDDRVRVAAPSCYVTSWEEQLKDTGPQDAEQQFPDQLLAGINHDDLVALFAPKPYLICSSTEDFFPLEGARQTYVAAKRIYALFGAADRISWFSEPGPHGIGQPGREAVYAWMKRWLRGDENAEVEPEPLFQTEYEEDLNCTPTGQVLTSLGGETPSSWNIKRFSEITSKRPVLKTAEDVDRLKAAVKDEVLRLTRFRTSQAPLNLRSLGHVRRQGYRVERLIFDADRGRYVPALLCVPESQAASGRRPVIYLDGQGMAAGLRPGGDADQLARLGYTVLALDPAGIGETTSDWSYGGSSANWFGQEKIAWLALMTGQPLVGIRMGDIVRGLEVLAGRKLLGDDGALGYAKGSAGVDLLHAAAIEPRISGVVVEEGLISYEAIARAPLHRRVFESVVPGSLGKYDLPHLAASLAPRAVWLVNLVSPMGVRSLRKDVESAYEYAATAYRVAGAASALHIRLRREIDAVSDTYPELR